MKCLSTVLIALLIVSVLPALADEAINQSNYFFRDSPKVFVAAAPESEIEIKEIETPSYELSINLKGRAAIASLEGAIALMMGDTKIVMNRSIMVITSEPNFEVCVVEGKTEFHKGDDKLELSQYKCAIKNDNSFVVVEKDKETITVLYNSVMPKAETYIQALSEFKADDISAKLKREKSDSGIEEGAGTLDIGAGAACLESAGGGGETGGIDMPANPGIEVEKRSGNINVKIELIRNK